MLVVVDIGFKLLQEHLNNKFMIVIFNQDGTFNLTCDSLDSIQSFIDSTNSPYIETDEKLDFANYTYTLANGEIVKTEITDRPVLD